MLSTTLVIARLGNSSSTNIAFRRHQSRNFHSTPFRDGHRAFPSVPRKPTMKLRNLRFPGTIPYARAAALQESLVKQFLAAKASNGTLAPPSPTIITSQFHPVYTCGRREVGSVDAAQQAFLRAEGRAEFVEALRGGQTTFHGPGQMVAYPIVDLRTHGLTPRNYVCTLEKGVIATLKDYGIVGFRTADPGVWVSDDDKIASVGVHMRRNVTSHGVAVNVNTDLWWFDRIVACGLEGKRATSLQKLGVSTTVEEVARVFVERFAKSIGCEEVEVVDIE